MGFDLFYEKAKELIKSGLAYMCVGGEGYGDLDNLFDDESVMLEIDAKVEPDDGENVIVNPRFLGVRNLVTRDRHLTKGKIS